MKMHIEAIIASWEVTELPERIRRSILHLRGLHTLARLQKATLDVDVTVHPGEESS